MYGANMVKAKAHLGHFLHQRSLGFSLRILQFVLQLVARAKYWGYSQ
jgi:hypothetical protein